MVDDVQLYNQNPCMYKEIASEQLPTMHERVRMKKRDFNCLRLFRYLQILFDHSGNENVTRSDSN